jgi:2-pyrone-4,6-dicarboxylate lactonase
VQREHGIIVPRDDSAIDIAEGFLLPPEHPRAPRRTPPPGATDCHAHIFGPFDRFPLSPERHYTPAEFPVERYLAMLDDIGFARGVLVQGGAHGTDCGALLSALDLAPRRLRGIALVEPQVTDAQLLMMSERGICGARFSRLPDGLNYGAVPIEALFGLSTRLLQFGWHAQLQASSDHLVAILPELMKLKVPLVLDHMALVDVKRGVGDLSFQMLLRWLGEGKIWLKMTAYRASEQYPHYEDVAPFHARLLAENPERLIWGSDWPHVHLRTNMPDVGQLVDVFDAWTSDETLRRRILVDNPAVLYGFDAP